MADASGSAAPAAPASGAPSQQATTPAPAAAKQDAPAAWSDTDDADLFSRLAKSPYGKFTADGKEHHLKSKDDLQSVLRAYQRTSGVQRALEEAKRGRQESDRIRGEANEVLSLVESARGGDEEAWRRLGLVSPSERKALQEELAKLPPEQRALYEQNQAMQRQLAEQQRAERQRVATEQREALTTQVRKVAAEVAQSIGMESADADTLMSVAHVMDELQAAGAELGVNVTPDDVRDFALEQMEAGLLKRVARLPHGRALERMGDYLRGAPPEALLQALSPVLAKTPPEAFFAALGEAARPWAKAASAWYVRQVKGGAGGVEQAPPEKPEPQQRLAPQSPGPRVLGLGLGFPRR